MKRSPYALAAACAVAALVLSGCMGHRPWGDHHGDKASMPQHSRMQESVRQDYTPLPVHEPH